MKLVASSTKGVESECFFACGISTKLLKVLETGKDMARAGTILVTRRHTTKV